MTTLPTTPAPDSRRDAPANGVLWKWSVACAALLLVFVMWRCGSALVQGRKLADAAVRHFHERLNAGDYEDIYDEADEGFRTGQSHDQSIKFMEAVHRKLGLARQETRLNVRVDTNARGTFLTTQYSTAFATGTATEMFTWVESSGTLRLYGYHIQSNALILNEQNPTPGTPGLWSQTPSLVMRSVTSRRAAQWPGRPVTLGVRSARSITPKLSDVGTAVGSLMPTQSQPAASARSHHKLSPKRIDRIGNLNRYRLPAPNARCLCFAFTDPQ